MLQGSRSGQPERPAGIRLWSTTSGGGGRHAARQPCLPHCTMPATFHRKRFEIVTESGARAGVHRSNLLFSCLDRSARDLFDSFPPSVRRGVRRVARRPGPRRIALADLDGELDQVAELFTSSEDAARSRLAEFELAPSGDPPSDPFSREYERWAWELYVRISGRSSYTLSNETSPIDVAGALLRPFPGCTGSATVVGEDLEARGQVLRCLGANGIVPPATIVEYGPGWGNLTCDLAATGYEVTAVEIDPGFCELISARRPEGGTLTVEHADMLTFSPGKPLDAAVFFECFHHCADHRLLLQRLHECVAPDGLVLLAGEPVGEMPFPWGPRIDGLSLWSMRRYGWLELGFDARYFAMLLDRTGWKASRQRLRARAPKSDILVLRPTASAG